MERYEAKRAVIIGGTSGMGLATAKMLLDGGARVLVTGRSQAGLESAQKELGKGAIVVSSDARSLTDIDALASRVKAEFDTFDLLFVNAGFSIRAPLESMTEAVYDEMFNLNAKGPLFAVQKLAPLINRGGSVVLTTSIANVKGMPGNAAYGAAKAALRSFARTLAAELLPREIRVNAVSPGPIDTPIIGKAFPDKDVAAQIREQMGGMIPDEALRDVGGNRQGRPLPRVRRDLHDRRGTSGRWGVVATVKVAHRCAERGVSDDRHSEPSGSRAAEISSRARGRLLLAASDGIHQLRLHSRSHRTLGTGGGSTKGGTAPKPRSGPRRCSQRCNITSFMLHDYSNATGTSPLYSALAFADKV